MDDNWRQREYAQEAADLAHARETRAKWERKENALIALWLACGAAVVASFLLWPGFWLRFAGWSALCFGACAVGVLSYLAFCYGRAAVKGGAA
ncbi:MAG TPA: hypothetical protein PL193_07685 [Xanthobacteraceae bacterium]|nr:hypothetical protein [Xanthobacteraceae bacterium]